MPFRKLVALLVLSSVMSIGISFVAMKFLRPEPAPVAESKFQPVPSEKVADLKKTAVPAAETPTVPKAEVPNPAFPISGVTMTGWVKRGKRILVSLSDGTTLNENHAALQEVNGSSFAIIAGRMVPMKAKVVPPRVEGVGMIRLGEVNDGALVSPQIGQGGSVEAVSSPEERPAVQENAGQTPSKPPKVRTPTLSKRPA